MTHAAADVLHATYSPVSGAPAVRNARALAIMGVITAAAFVVGIVAVSMIPDQLNGGAFDKALTEIATHRHAEVVAGWMFAIGLATLIPFIWLVVRSLSDATRLPATIGACLITAGATIDIAGSLLLVAVGHGLSPSFADPAVRAVAGAMLHLSVALDSMYNLTLGAGLVMIGRSMRAGGAWPRWTANLAIVAGVLSLPVALEWYSELAGAAQYASGTLLLAWVVGLAVAGMKRAA